MDEGKAAPAAGKDDIISLALDELRPPAERVEEEVKPEESGDLSQDETTEEASSESEDVSEDVEEEATEDSESSEDEDEAGEDEQEAGYLGPAEYRRTGWRQDALGGRRESIEPGADGDRAGERRRYRPVPAAGEPAEQPGE